MNAMTTVSDIMTRDVRCLSPADSLDYAAQAMDELDVGAILVCTGEKVVGMVTDRDIIVRAVAQGLATGETPLSAIMTSDVLCCREDQPVFEVMLAMGDAQVRRMPVVDRNRNLIGIVSLGDIAVKTEDGKVAVALQEISEPAES